MDPVGEEERSRFAHYVWNVKGFDGEACWWTDGRDKGLKGTRKEMKKWRNKSGGVLSTFGGGRSWWLSRAEEDEWSVKGQRVLELGAVV